MDGALAQPASASICERINSEFGFVTHAQHHNLRLMKRTKKVATSLPLWMLVGRFGALTVTKFEPLKVKNSCLLPGD